MEGKLEKRPEFHKEMNIILQAENKAHNCGHDMTGGQGKGELENNYHLYLYGAYYVTSTMLNTTIIPFDCHNNLGGLIILLCPFYR